jgi:hypothetical protein
MERGMRPVINLVGLACFFLAAPLATLDAQGRSSTIISIPNPLFAYSSEASVYCGPAPLEQWHREQGIGRLFQFQLPLHSRTGVFGLDGFGHPRYLSVVLEQAAHPHYLRYHATVQFARDGKMEVGRQSRTVVRFDSVVAPQVDALNQWEAAEALGLARLLAERCRLVR